MIAHFELPMEASAPGWCFSAASQHCHQLSRRPRVIAFYRGASPAEVVAPRIVALKLLADGSSRRRID